MIFGGVSWKFRGTVELRWIHGMVDWYCMYVVRTGLIHCCWAGGLGVWSESACLNMTILVSIYYCKWGVRRRM